MNSWSALSTFQTLNFELLKSNLQSDLTSMDSYQQVSVRGARERHQARHMLTRSLDTSHQNFLPLIMKNHMFQT